MASRASFKKVVISGGTGLVGGYLLQHLAGRAERRIVLTRDAEAARNDFGPDIELFQWLPHEDQALADCLDGADAVFHLAGASIGGHRWTTRYKDTILRSRTESTAALVQAMTQCRAKPRVLICPSGVNYYGGCGEERIDESVTAGTSFLADVCVRWEVAAEQAESIGVRVVRARSGFVLAPDAEAVRRLLLPFKLFVGGPIASGKQGMSWIHIDDLLGLLLRAATDDSITGPLNAVSPNPVSNAEFMRTIAKVLHRPALMWVPGFMLKLILGEMADEMLIQGQYVVPAKALEAGYSYRFPILESALRDLLK